MIVRRKASDIAKKMELSAFMMKMTHCRDSSILKIAKGCLIKKILWVNPRATYRHSEKALVETQRHLGISIQNFHNPMVNSKPSIKCLLKSSGATNKKA